MKLRITHFKITLFVLVLFLSCQESKRNLNPKKLVGGFELLSPNQTGIDFNNKIKEGIKFNQYFYTQIYNGSGVAVGDINNDGLLDIFFGGNQEGDRLYLNK